MDKTISFIFLCLCGVALYVVFAAAAVSPELTARSVAYQQERTARYIAEQQRKSVEAQEFGDTMRVWGMWGAGVLAVAAVAGAGAWSTVEWQRQRTRRHGMTEHRLVVLAYIAAFGGRELTVGGVPGVYLDDAREFVPWRIAAAELRSAPMLTVDAE